MLLRPCRSSAVIAAVLRDSCSARRCRAKGPFASRSSLRTARELSYTNCRPGAFEDVWKEVSDRVLKAVDSSVGRPGSQETGSANPDGANTQGSEFNGEERIYTASGNPYPSLVDHSSQEPDSTCEPGRKSSIPFLRRVMRQYMRTLPYPVAIVTASEQRPHAQYKDCTYAATVSSFNTVCLDPEPYVSFNLAANSITRATIAATRHFTVTFLEDTRGAAKLASRFSKGNMSSPFAQEESSMGHGPIELSSWDAQTIPPPHAPGLRRLPPGLVVPGVTAFTLLCEQTQSILVGDHVLIIGRVLRTASHKGYSTDERYWVGNSPTTSVHTCLSYAQGAYSTEEDGTRFGDLTQPVDPYVLEDFSSLSNEERSKIRFRYRRRIALIQAGRSSEKDSEMTPKREQLRNRMVRYFRQRLDALTSSGPPSSKRTKTRFFRPVSRYGRLATNVLEWERERAPALKSNVDESHTAVDSNTVLSSGEELREVQEGFSSSTDKGKIRTSFFLRWDRERAEGNTPGKMVPLWWTENFRSRRDRRRLVMWFRAWERSRAAEKRDPAAPLETNMNESNTVFESLTVLKSAPCPDPESEGEKHKHPPSSAPGSELEVKRAEPGASATGAPKVRRRNRRRDPRGYRRIHFE